MVMTSFKNYLSENKKNEEITTASANVPRRTDLLLIFKMD